MGFRICYLASKAAPDELIEKLGLTKGNSVEEMPAGVWWAAKLENSGWTILWSEDENFGGSVQAEIAELSQTHQTYICEVNETVMWSSSELWEKGQQVWKVTHAGDGEDRFNLSEIGELPENYTALKQLHFLNQKQEEENVDHIFEIPLDLPALRIGFRHEDYLETKDVTSFEVVAPKKKRNLLSRIFGG
ncbi:hypothetical protein MHM39_14670 [Phaeobacter sp. CNT1-3]|nr:hypothetical protein [Phaeobacter sp. CNT1-3]